MTDQQEDTVGVARGVVYPPSIMYKLDEEQFRQLIDILKEISTKIWEARGY